ncbi:hypothetical protein [Geodermatophilus sp. DSM 45219]|uniref:hypothetical protein n=1 Tax=Geodermatophilus sp. DSM 45219 TaxID=1881103 RepID=UPI00087E1A4C|nr:hypothetical protein [Geodermatophilus sp. DSM 45219]SDN59780.1 hypothetical protein SAMN05428965_1104 [Geodermatophilus sp. DSM 45219]
MLVAGEAAVLAVVLVLATVTDRSGPTPAVLVTAAQLARALSTQQLATRSRTLRGARPAPSRPG